MSGWINLGFVGESNWEPKPFSGRIALSVTAFAVLQNTTVIFSQLQAPLKITVLFAFNFLQLNGLLTRFIRCIHAIKVFERYAWIVLVTLYIELCFWAITVPVIGLTKCHRLLAD